MELKPTGAALGVEVTGVDMRSPLPEAERRAIRDALLQHGVLFVRGQKLDERQFVDFARLFGEIERYELDAEQVSEAQPARDHRAVEHRRERQADRRPGCRNVLGTPIARMSRNRRGRRASTRSKCRTRTTALRSATRSSRA
jgi:alpha-ketoglutarate-dependent taurine dioxygenase